jgi:hypothetical protein
VCRQWLVARIFRLLTADVFLDENGFLTCSWPIPRVERVRRPSTLPYRQARWVRIVINLMPGEAEIRLYDAAHGGSLLDSATAQLQGFGPSDPEETEIAFFAAPNEGELVSAVWMDELEVFAS